jgi:fumarylacetoacetase
MGARPLIDRTHSVERRSWIESANHGSDFPIQNLPFGCFVPHGQDRPRGGVAVGDKVLDLRRAVDLGLFAGEALTAAEAAADETLNAFFALGGDARRALRARLVELLDAAGNENEGLKRHGGEILHDASGCRPVLPCAVGNYTDFFAGIQHATNTGRQFRPENPLLPNYKYVPVAYHGRASSVRVSGGSVRRPNGQMKPNGADAPFFGPSRRLDFELELGIWLGPGNNLGEPIPVGSAADHIAGFCLLNDWSARDIQAWESQPLGPFLAKNFATQISPWVITPEALAPFRIAQAPRPVDDPAPMKYLSDPADQESGALALELEVYLLTEGLRKTDAAPHRLTQVEARSLYWTPAQMVAHHTCGGCNLMPGDLFGSGTISGASDTSWGSLLEITQGGRNPLTLASGETRTFLQDGDEIILKAVARREGFVSIGFGECRGRIASAL